ncbi:hypothetical protein [Nocardioides abyssi]|uniref:Uncharacterized protein n=1 Tax=Nocardioides abyssi TaxID=3058370 RepID=A0ABT8ESK1_9ACTN|nr:hypothetical protein [Nocardioides abyssi]MDN4161125.1 hypothetical protein [Nocardioides abyssi]
MVARIFSATLLEAASARPGPPVHRSCHHRCGDCLYLGCVRVGAALLAPWLYRADWQEAYALAEVACQWASPVESPTPDPDDPVRLRSSGDDPGERLLQSSIPLLERLALGLEALAGLRPTTATLIPQVTLLDLSDPSRAMPRWIDRDGGEVFDLLDVLPESLAVDGCVRRRDVESEAAALVAHLSRTRRNFAGVRLLVLDGPDTSRWFPGDGGPSVPYERAADRNRTQWRESTCSASE